MQEIFHPDLNDIDLSTIFFALSDPIRLHIVKDIGNFNKEYTCAELQPEGIVKSTISHHFKVLRESGIIHTRMEGTNRFVSLRRDELEARFPGLFSTIFSITNSGEEL